MGEPTRRGVSLRTKTLAIILVATAVLSLAICLPLRAVVLSRFEAIERELAQRDVDRARNTLADQIAALHAQARDYAAWDETWEFLGGERADYADVNFVEATFVQNRIGLVVVVDRDGHERVSRAFDLHAGAPRDAPAHHELFPHETDVLFAHLHPDTDVFGLAPTDDGVMLVGAHAVLTSARTGPSRGTLVMGRMLDAPEVARIAETLRLDLSISPVDGPHPTDDVAAAVASLRAGDRDVLVRPIDDDTLGGYAILDDVRGEPCVVLRVSSPRTIYAQGREDATFIALSVAGATLLFGLLVLFLLQRIVVHRVARLGHEVGVVGATADHSLRVTARGDDELGKLATDVNGMLTSLEQLTRELDAERAKAERLLRNILPASIATRLKDREETIADSFPEVSVLFADIVGFTDLASHAGPAELVAMLNEIFSQFDALAERHGLEKIKTIGDAYMIVAGLPEPRDDHAVALANMALDMQDAIETFNAAHGSALAIRIGINTGPVVAGVIGTKKFIYDLWGDAVNIASRMESSGIAGRVQISETTYEKLRGALEAEARGAIAIKGKGEMRTWLLAARPKP